MGKISIPEENGVNLPTRKRIISSFSGSIISVVGKTTVEIIELFECRQKVP